MWLLLRTGLVPIIAGIGVGAASALVVTRGMATLLYGGTRFEIATFTVSVVVLPGVALAAAAVPARRIASIDEAQILRAD